MAADVSSVVNRGNSEMLITRDLLGALSARNGSNDLDPGLHRLKSETTSSNNFKAVEETNLELKLLTSNQCPSSVCTIDKVKTALQRAAKESSSSSSKKRSSSCSYTERTVTDDGGGENGCPATGMFAAACPGCLMYVMTQKENPKCPRCSSTVPSTFSSAKKPRLDLNTFCL